MTNCIHCGHQSDESFRFCPQCGSEAAVGADDDSTLVGRTLNGKYRVLGEIGSGGMGTVYRGKHLSLDKSVALKVLHPDLQVNDETIRRFQGEGIAAGKFSHPNVIQIFDFDQDDGLAYLAMEYVEGSNLREFLAERGRLEARLAVDLLVQVLRALAEAHRHGIVHRDLKPDNIMVSDTASELSVKVLDFGLSKLVDRPAGASLLTQVGRVLGTPHYMAPEQWRSGEVDHRIDLWAAGAILFELLAGRRPFGGETIEETLLRSTTDPTPSISSMFPKLHIPDDLDRIIAHALERDREQRYASAEEMIEDLEAVRYDVSSKPKKRSAAGTSGARRSRDSRRDAGDAKSSKPIWVAAGIVAVLVAGLLVWQFQSGAGGAGESSARVRTRDANSLTSEEVLYLSRLDDAKRELAAGDIDEARKAVERAHLFPFAGPEAFYVRGLVFRARADRDSARADFVEALKLDARDANAATQLAWLDLEDGKINAAMAGFEQAVSWDDQAADAKAGMGVVHERRGENEKAGEVLRDAVESAGTSAVPHYELGRFLLTQKDAEGARAAFVDAKRKAARDVRVFDGLATAYLELGRAKDAEAQWREALAIDAKADGMRRKLAALLLDGKRSGEAAEVLEPACGRQPSSVPLRTLQAVALSEQDDVAGAIAALEACRIPKSDHARAHALLATLYVSEKRFPEALESCETALAVDASLVQTRAQLASLLMRDAKFERAASELEAVLESDKDNTFALYLLTVLYKDYIGDRDKAKGYLQRYVDAGGDAKPVTELRELLGV